MAHQHDHTDHNHGTKKDGTAGRLWISIALNLVITLAEIIGGIISNSLALLSDALHNFSDTASLGISLIARTISGKDANADKTFGYRRAEIIGAFINLVTLVLISLFLIKEGVERFIEPQAVDGTVMFTVAIVGLLGNVITAMLLHSKSHDNINIRSAYVHIFTDALSSVGVILGGILVAIYQLFWIDALLTVSIGLYILWHTYHLLRHTIDILMESTPNEIDLDKVIDAMSATQYVQDIHHVHVWRLDEQQICLESHVAIKENDLQRMESIKNQLKKLLRKQFDIHHSTLEFEFEPCSNLGLKDCNELSSAGNKNPKMHVSE